MRDSKLVALKLLVWLALIGHINGCKPQSPPVERDVMRKLLASFVLPMGDLSIVSRPSDCRTDGQTSLPVPLGLFDAFLNANDEQSNDFDLSEFGDRVTTTTDRPRRLYLRTRKPVVSLSRAGMTTNDALVCVEVYAQEERAFFVFLRREGSTWRLAGEVVSWEEPEEEDLTEDPEDGY